MVQDPVEHGYTVLNLDMKPLDNPKVRTLITDSGQVFNAAQDDCSSDLPTDELLKRFYPDVPVRGDLGTYETLLSNRKAREGLGFKQEHSWRRYVSPDSGSKGATQ